MVSGGKRDRWPSLPTIMFTNVLVSSCMVKELSEYLLTSAMCKIIVMEVCEFVRSKNRNSEAYTDFASLVTAFLLLFQN